MNETAHPKMREYQRHIGGDSPIYQERKYAAAFSMDLSKTADPYVMRIETFISDSPMSYLSLIGIYDEDLHVRRRIKAACEAAGYAWPEGRTTANFMHPTWPSVYAGCVPRLRVRRHRDRVRRPRGNSVGHRLGREPLPTCGADMLANARKRLENEMRPRGIEPDGEQAVKDAETVRQAGLNAITPSFFELFEDYIAEEDSQLAADGVELEARTAWMHEMYLTMLNTLKE